MSSSLSIETASKVTPKQWIKRVAGQAVSYAYPQKTKHLLGRPTGSPSGLIDKLLMAHLKERAKRLGHVEFFENLHRDFWQGDGGAVFAKNCDHRFEDLFLSKQKEDFDALQALWNSVGGIDRIVEFGCNSGLVLNYLTQNLDGVKSATGIEINQNQVDANQASEGFDSRVKFECADGGDWLFKSGKPSTLFVTNGGVLEYFRRERLNEMLTLISKRLEPALVFSIEPVASDHDWSKTKESIPFGEELSFSHNYTDLFESNGFEIVHQRATEFESWKMMATVAKAIG
ncbi:MAG: methyltransferase domain-containing protein [Mariniblastus sp.]